MTKDSERAEEAFRIIRALKRMDASMIPVIEKYIADARKEGRAAAYAEAIEKAVETFDGFSYTTGLSVDQNIAFVNALRALAPAATTEEPK